MRVEVAMEDGVAHRQVLVAAAVVDRLQGEGRAGSDRLAVQVVAARGVGRVQPLVGVQVMDVMQVRAAVQDAELGVVLEVAVVDVRGIVRVERLGRRLVVGAGVVRVAGGRHRAAPGRRAVDDHRRVAVRPRGQEELLVLAVGALTGGPDLEAVGEDLGADAAHAVVDREVVVGGGQGGAELAVGVEVGERLEGPEHLVVDERELAVGLQAVGRRLDLVEGGFPGVGVGEAAGVGTGDDRRQVAVHQLAVLQHVQHRQVGPGVPGSKVSWTRQSDHMPAAKCG